MNDDDTRSLDLLRRYISACRLNEENWLTDFLEDFIRDCCCTTTTVVESVPDNVISVVRLFKLLPRLLDLLVSSITLGDALLVDVVEYGPCSVCLTD